MACADSTEWTKCCRRCLFSSSAYEYKTTVNNYDVLLIFAFYHNCNHVRKT